MRGSLAITLVAGLSGLVVFAPACSPRTEPVSSSYDYSFYRFDDNFESASAVEGADEMPGADAVRLALDKTSADGWTSDSGEARIRGTDNSVLFRSNHPDVMISPAGLAIDGTKTESLILRMRVSGPPLITLMWLPPDPEQLWAHRVIRFNVPRQNEMITYNLRVSAAKSWHIPEIDRLRFILDSAATVEIESLQAVTSRAVFAAAPAGRVNYCVADDSRPAVYARCPGRIAYDLKIPPNAAFTADLTVVDQNAPVEFNLAVKEGAQTQTILSEVVDDPEAWLSVKADLSAYAGKNVELSLASSCDTAGQVAVWANPVMFQRLEGAAPEAPRPPNVLLYVVDCMRADHLDCYGYPRETMPFAAQLAGQGVRFEHCYAQDTWTKSSMTSLATGVDQVRHGVEQYGDIAPRGLKMLPEALRENGYATCAVSENPHTPPETVDRAVYSRIEPINLHVQNDNIPWRDLPPYTFEAATEFMEANRDKPFFLYVHTMEAHDVSCPQRPCEQLFYDAPEPYKSMFGAEGGQAPMDVYDGALAYADANFKRVLDKLEELGLADDTVIIFTGDHGEAFAEHEDYCGHGWKTFNTLIRVPLVIRFPGVFEGGKSVSSNVQLLDVAPTLLHVLGLPSLEQFEGRSLVELAQDGGGGVDNRLIFSKWFGSAAMIRNNWKLMYEYAQNEAKLFNVKTDPGEKNDLAASEPRIAQALEKNLHDHVAAQTALHEALTKDTEDEAVGIDPRVQEQLEALGYLGGDNHKRKEN